jgi:DNA-binding IclR family transcriptional regulator
MQVVVRALDVLRVLSGEHRGLAMGEISQRVEMPLASTHRILRVLEGERFVTRSSSNKRYFLGPAARELAHRDLARESPLVTPHAAVAEASRTTGETVFLSELVGSRVICLALAESGHPLRLFVRVGQEMPLHAAAAPVRSSTDEVVASVTLAAPMHRMETDADREGAKFALLKAAASMSADLGWEPAAVDQELAAH